MGAFLVAVFFILIGIFVGAVLIAWGQAYGTVPLKKRNGSPRYPVHWEVPFEMVLVVFMTAPVAVMLYVTLVAMSEAQMLVDIGMVVCAGLVLLMALENFQTCCRYLASERWPTTRGRLFMARRLLWKSETEYSYEVSGKRLFGDKIDAHDYLKSPRYIAYDRHNAEVTVHYHPSNPEIALLEPGVNWSSVSVMLSIAINLVAVPLFFSLV